MPKRYKVVGTTTILDHKPGATFEKDIDPDLEAYLLAIGGIAVVEKPVEKKALKSADRR